MSNDITKAIVKITYNDKKRGITEQGTGIIVSLSDTKRDAILTVYHVINGFNGNNELLKIESDYEEEFKLLEVLHNKSDDKDLDIAVIYIEKLKWFSKEDNMILPKDFSLEVNNYDVRLAGFPSLIEQEGLDLDYLPIHVIVENFKCPRVMLSLKHPFGTGREYFEDEVAGMSGGPLYCEIDNKMYLLGVTKKIPVNKDREAFYYIFYVWHIEWYLDKIEELYGCDISFSKEPMIKKVISNNEDKIEFINMSVSINSYTNVQNEAAVDVWKIIKDERVNDLKNSIIRYCRLQLDKMCKQKMYDENFSVFDLYVYPNAILKDKAIDNIQISYDNMAELSSTYLNQNIEHDFSRFNMTSNKETSEPVMRVINRCLNGQNITLILGSPGMGKSTFIMVLYKELMDHLNQLIIPIYVELKRLIFSNGFTSSITEYLKRFIKNFETADFSEFNFILLLDGFDELKLLLVGELQDFFDSVRIFQEDYPNIKIVITGRSSALIGLKDILSPKYNIVFLDYFHEEQVNKWLEKWSSLNGLSKQIFDFKELETSSINELTRTPLLLYLICKILKEKSEEQLAKDMLSWNKISIFKTIIDWTCSNSKFTKFEESEILKGFLSSIERSKLIREINKNIAICMNNLNKNTITGSEILERDILPEALKDTQEEKKPHIIKTMLTLSYMNPAKANEDEQEYYAVEFVHNSFKEYLTSEFLIDKINEISLLYEKRNDLGAVYVSKEIAKILYNFFGTVDLSKDINDFFVPMLHKLEKSIAKNACDAIKSLYYNNYLDHNVINEYNNNILIDIINLYPNLKCSLFKIEYNIGKNILIIITELSVYLGEYFKINREKTNDDFSRLISFLRSVDDTELWKFQKMNFKCADFSYAKLDNLEIGKLNAENANFGYANLNDSHISGTLYNCNFKEADLSRASMDYTGLSYCNFEKADLSYAILVESGVSKADFSEASLSEAHIEGTFFNKSKFEKASLIMTQMWRSDFEDCNFNHANLSSAVMRESNFKNATFINTCLRNVDLEEADLTGADMSNANLSNAKINKAIFEGTNLTNVDLTNVDIENIDFSKTIIDGCYSRIIKEDIE
jgi:Uncharacterized low-complexity proteins